MARKTKRSSPGRNGYSAEKRAEILAATRRENFAGAQAHKRFGIATLTSYRWRDPVRRENLLPEIIRKEVVASLKVLA